jgi:NADPH-dependent 2,4-dienoyl-CoA reductase/sulfur reductase-like enzyme/rhodanese-related sulfurtransferase
MTAQERKVVVVGASAAGLRCAARLSRLEPNFSITVVEQAKEFSWAACGLPYVLSGDIPELALLRRTADGMMRDPDYFRRVKGVEVLSGCRAERIDAERNTLSVKSGTEERILEWDDLVLATGAEPRPLPNQPVHPRVCHFHSAKDLAPLQTGLKEGEIENVVIIGAGLIGIELTEAFSALWGAEVTLIETADAPLPRQLDKEVGGLVAKILKDEDVALVTGTAVESINPSDDGVKVIAGGEEIAGDVVVVAAGVSPSVELASSIGIELGSTGAIAVSEQLATSIPHIWAAGDCIETRSAVTGKPSYVPLGSLANRQGRTLAGIISSGEGTFGPIAAAASVKIFDFNVASVGITRCEAQRLGLNARSSWVVSRDRADYYPGAKEIFLHMVYEQGSGRVLGVQGFGEGEVSKRIDTASQLIKLQATISDFAELEHAYSPPYAPAMEPLAVAAMVALNQESGLEAIRPDSAFEGTVVDVRHPEGREARPCPCESSIAAPIEDLRGGDVDLGTGPFIVVCERGIRSSEAGRILRSRGAKIEYLGGGLQWRRAVGS